MTPKQLVAALKKHGSLRAVHRNTKGVSWHAIRKLHYEAVEAGLVEQRRIGSGPRGKGGGGTPGPALPFDTPEQLVKEFEKYGSLANIGRAHGQKMPLGTRSKIVKLYREAVDKDLMDAMPAGAKSREQMKTPEPRVDGKVRSIETRVLPAHKKGVRRMLFTCAQNNTHLHEGLWDNLLALKKHYDATLYVARFTYKKEAYGTKSVKPGKGPTALDKAALKYDNRIEPYICDDRLEVAPGLVWCGEFNRLPTTSRPLSGFESYTGRKSGIFPHVKIAMESVASMRDEPTKFNYTTGTVTVRNYIQKAVGIKAEFHHCYGALLVEVTEEGHWFCRQINADSEGTIYDLDVCVREGKVTTGNRVEAILWGDIHVAQIEEGVKRLAWGAGGMLDKLRPWEQHMGDVLDFRSRSHHEMKDPHKMFKRHVRGVENVGEEVAACGEFLEHAYRRWCKTVVVDSNHHDHLGRWLKEQDGRADPVNSEFWFAMQSRTYAMLRGGASEVNYFKEALTVAGYPKIESKARFLNPDESYIICRDANGGIECGLHGHNGLNGSRGSTMSYVKMGRKVNKAHDHTATITDGVYSAGTCSIMDPDWVHGPGGWSWSHILTYLNGKRAIITMFGDKWRA